ncbi:MAG: histidinol-phosphate transaminase [Spirochaetota bacterium]
MKYWNSKLKKMTEYIPGEQPANVEEYTKLNSNENPFPPFKQVLETIKKTADEKLRFYPDPNSKSLRETFAKQNRLKSENVFAGNGSDEIFTLIFRGFIEPGGVAAFPYPSYSLYYTMAEAHGIKYDKINLKKPFDVDFNEFLKKKYELVIVANPNNPTGRGIETDKIEKFLKKFNGLLVVDEAYVDFYGESAIDLINEYDNIIITRSFSKSYSLAGLRIGLAIANSEIIRGLFKLKDSYNLNRISEAAAIAAVLDNRSFKYNIEMLINNKEYLENQLTMLGFETIPSKANFLFVTHPQVKAKQIYEELKNKKILVRYFEGPIQADYIRITVGTMMQIKSLVAELSSIVKV